MSTRKVYIFILLAFLSFTKVSAQDSLSSKHLLNAVLWYQRSPELRANYLQAYRLAQIALDQNLLTAAKDNPKAVVVDVDETVLDNSPFMGYLYKTNKAFTNSDWHRWVVMEAAKALPGALKFLKYAETKNVEVFYITNRSADDKTATINNLKKEGFPFVDDKHVMCMTAGSSKAARRTKLAQTHDILLLVGDNLSDLDSVYDARNADSDLSKVDAMAKDFGSRYIILPNPMYGDWENAIFKRDDSNAVKDRKRKESVISFE